MNVVHDHTPTHPHHLNAGFNNYPHTLVAKNIDNQRRHTLMVTTDMLPEARANIPGLQGKPHPTPPHPTPPHPTPPHPTHPTPLHRTGEQLPEPRRAPRHGGATRTQSLSPEAQQAPSPPPPHPTHTPYTHHTHTTHTHHTHTHTKHTHTPHTHHTTHHTPPPPHHTGHSSRTKSTFSGKGRRHHVAPPLVCTTMQGRVIGQWCARWVLMGSTRSRRGCGWSGRGACLRMVRRRARPVHSCLRCGTRLHLSCTPPLA